VHIQSFVDQAVVSDPESQKVPDYPLMEIQQAVSNDDYLSALRPASQLKLLSCVSPCTHSTQQV
jgi:hypothetical protein